MKKFNMKKTTAAAVAATVGAVLLLGGAGTLAYWSDTAVSTDQTISSGTLDVSGSTTNTWYYDNALGSVPANVVNQIVPGDTVKTTISVPVKLVGKNLKAQLEVTRTAASASNLAGAIVTTKVGDTIGAANATVVTSQTLTTASSAPTAVDVVVTVQFPASIETKDGMSNADATVTPKALQFKLDYLFKQIA